MLLRMRYVGSSLSVVFAAASSLYPSPNTSLLVNRDLPGSDKGCGTYGIPIANQNSCDNSTTEMNNTSSTAHTQRKTGISLPCTNSSRTQANAACTSILREEGISPNHLYNLNVPGKGLFRNSTSSSSATISTLVGQAAPSPTQTGISPSCNRYSQAHEGIQCGYFANASGITADNLYSWNTVLGPTGEGCETHFLAKHYDCVGTTSKVTNLAVVKVVTNGSVSAAPEPTQKGISPSCTQYSQAPQRDTCATLNIAKDSGISKQQFYTWNGILGPKGQSCDANYWAKYWYCVGINPAFVGRVSSSSTSNLNLSTMSVPTPHTLPSHFAYVRKHRRVLTHRSEVETGASASGKRG